MSAAEQVVGLIICSGGAVFALAWLGLWLVDKLGGDTTFGDDDDYWT